MYPECRARDGTSFRWRPTGLAQRRRGCPLQAFREAIRTGVETREAIVAVVRAVDRPVNLIVGVQVVHLI